MTMGMAFMTWTDQGARDYRGTVDRFETAKKLAEQFHVQIKEIYWTPGGPYDLVSLAEGPDTKALGAFVLALEGSGDMRATWAEAYGPDEMRALLATGG